MTKPLTAEELIALGVATPSPEVKAAVNALVNDSPKKTEDVVDSERAAFLVHILGGKPYLRTFKAFGDMLEVEFRSLTAAQLDLAAQAANAAASQESTGERIRLYHEFRIILTLSSLTLNGNKVPNPLPASIEELAKQRQEYLANTTAGLNGVITELFVQFESSYNQMLAEANNPSFWKTGG